MQGTLFINGKDAYTTWGITLSETSLSALMTPSSIKAPVENKGRGADGKQVLIPAVPKIDEREISLMINLSAPNETAFFQRYQSFCTELEKGRLDIRTKYQPNIVYHFVYVSCNQFSEFMRGIASFTLRLNEPNPQNRR